MCPVVDNPSVPELVEAIERLRSDAVLRSRLTRNALRAAKLFESKSVAAEFRAKLGKNRA